MAARYLAALFSPLPSKQSMTTPSFAAVSRSFTATTTCFCSPKDGEKNMEIDYGVDYNHWIVVLEKIKGNDPVPNRDDLIDSYIKTLAKVVGSEQDAKDKIYSTQTIIWHFFGALVSEQDAEKLKELPNVKYVLPDCYNDVKNKKYGEQPFCYGHASNMQQHVDNCESVKIGDGAKKMLMIDGKDAWRLFMEWVIRFKISYLCIQDMMYRFEVFKSNLAISDERSRNEFDRSLDLTREELCKPESYHSIIRRGYRDSSGLENGHSSWIMLL